MNSSTATPSPGELEPRSTDLATSEGLRTHTLGNGLRIVAERDRRVPLAAVHLTYGVGARDEDPGRNGFAHLFEHLMFEGSANAVPGEHFALLQAVGSTVNGTTGFDRTTYYETVPPGHLELALWLEADRLRDLSLAPQTFDIQREVVKNERRQRYDNRPYGDALELLHSLAYPEGHPYRRLPIGSPADLDAASLEDALAFHARWYRPDNCVVTVVGDADPHDVLSVCERLFAAIPSGVDRPSRPMPTLPPRIAGPQRNVLTARVPAPHVTVGIRVSRCDRAAEHAAVHVLAAALGRGRGSRLHRELVIARQLVQPHARLLRCRQLHGDASLLVARLPVSTGVDPAAVEEAFESVLASVMERVDVEELERIRAIVVRDHFEGLDTCTARAAGYGVAAALDGDPALALNDAARLLAVGPDDVQDAARRYFGPSNRAIVVHQPEHSR